MNPVPMPAVLEAVYNFLRETLDVDESLMVDKFEVTMDRERGEIGIKVNLYDLRRS